LARRAVGTVLGCSPRTAAHSVEASLAVPRCPPTARCPPATHPSTLRHACRDAYISRFSPRLAILPRDPALAASPSAGYIFRVGRSGCAPPHFFFPQQQDEPANWKCADCKTAEDARPTASFAPTCAWLGSSRCHRGHQHRRTRPVVKMGIFRHDSLVIAVQD
jgi:hypothetical protein